MKSAKAAVVCLCLAAAVTPAQESAPPAPQAPRTGGLGIGVRSTPRPAGTGQVQPGPTRPATVGGTRATLPTRRIYDGDFRRPLYPNGLQRKLALPTRRIYPNGFDNGKDKGIGNSSRSDIGLTSRDRTFDRGVVPDQAPLTFMNEGWKIQPRELLDLARAGDYRSVADSRGVQRSVTDTYADRERRLESQPRVSMSLGGCSNGQCGRPSLSQALYRPLDQIGRGMAFDDQLRSGLDEGDRGEHDTALENMAQVGDDPQGAVASLRFHLLKQPDDLRAMRLLAVALLGDKQPTDAAWQMLRAYEADPLLPQEPLDPSEMGLNAPEFHERVLTSLTHARRLKTHAGWFTAAVMLQAQGKHPEALRCLDRARDAGLPVQAYEPMAAALARK
jgi:hypothetical protein